MAFAPDLVRDHTWGSALAEDAGFHLELVLKGEHVAFEPSAFVLGHVPSDLAAAETQNRRWEAGRVDLVRTFLGRLLARMARGGGILALDSVLDLLIPPLSALVAGLALLAAVGFLVSPSLGVFNLSLLVGVAVHVLWGMAIGGARAVHYRSLVMGPLFLVWKLRLYLPILAGRRPEGWLRTERD
jgi:cellulose synthase/poly-beta-1,6-N-acetylglucosamine synthase-like glycosyltransferase